MEVTNMNAEYPYADLAQKFSKSQINFHIAKVKGDTFVKISPVVNTPVIEIEDNKDWISIRTDFYLTIEHSISRMTNKKRIRDKVCKLIEDMLTYGCDAIYTYRKGNLVKTDYYVNNKRVETVASGLNMFGEKTVKREHYAFQ